MKRRLNQLFPKLQKIGILGSGLSGKGCAQLCTTLGIAYELLDEKGTFYPKPYFKDYDLCVLSPGFSPNHPWIQALQQQAKPYVTEIDFAALCLKNPIIAVTGTNGKTSVTEALAQILCLSGRSACAVGNNGNVLSEVVAKGLDSKEILICEISSYQAWALRYLRPIYTLWTNIAEDHITYHGSFKQYFNAKCRLLELTQNFVVCGYNLKTYLKNRERVIVAESYNHLKDWFSQFPPCISMGQCENFSLLKTFSQQFGISQALLELGLKNFKPPSHRLYCCAKKGNCEFWNDSKGTNLHAVQAALESLNDKANLYWILGGRSKGESLKSFSSVFNCYSNVKKIFLIGETGKELLENNFKAQLEYTMTLEGVFSKLKQEKAPFTIVLSPGFSSWDQFQSYAERGTLFEQLAQTFNL